jgi:cytochrome c oxidase subunit 2
MIFSGATGISGRVVDNVFLYILVVCLFLLGLITFLMVYFVIHYRREKHPQPADIEGSTWLEITWTIIPTLIVLTMFYYGLTGFDFLKKVPPGAMVVKVVARQWSWLFQYENGIQDGELRVPVGKQDAVPGMTNYLWFQPTETGRFEVMCSQYCGLEHSHMLTKIVVLPEEEFTQWYQGKKAEGATKGPAVGSDLYQAKGCVACHTTDGSPRVGPTFKGLYGKTVTVMTEGKERKVLADEAYLRKSIREPNADLVKGFPPVMPPGKITSEELNALVDYIKILK